MVFNGSIVNIKLSFYYYGLQWFNIKYKIAHLIGRKRTKNIPDWKRQETKSRINSGQENKSCYTNEINSKRVVI